ncbi:endonuclease NucS [Halocalculus aciditolerans]|uniref:Endonuclease NucS n=1 Tax=Halocalculus aciditolerans TaxID=1383812 RepID=A0A830F036_9EURY|nr:endonuclease NucS [Halocalculus aciditolerans]GGL47764.1 endonuclease NucS [Halocalculus aciditolerans]
MGSDRLTDPEPAAAVDLVGDAFRDNAMFTIEADCEVEYDGRTSGYLGPGERLLVGKGDGTFLVHQPTGHKPVNWMPGGGTISASVSDGDLVVVARRVNPRERVEVRATDVHGITRFDAHDAAEYRESGTEAEMHQYIEAHPDELETGLRIVEHERETKYGFIDFFATDADGTPVVVEVKRVQATLNHFDQLKRYVSLYEETNSEVRGMLVAPAASDRVKRALRDADLEFVRLAEFETEAAPTKATLSDF